jgi:proteasome lid subunit RPN8/RPN11
MSDPIRVWMSAELAEKIRRHGEESYPHECCGALLGRDSSSEGGVKRPREILELYPLLNRREDSPRNRFSVAPRDVINADLAAQARGLDVVGWYHSHPDHPARPSEYDREHAWPWYSYIIVSIPNAAAGAMTCWRLQDDRAGYAEESLEVRTQTKA